MRTLVDIFVYGDPAPQGSKRHVGHGVMIESSKRVAPWREAIGVQVRYSLDSRDAEAPMLPASGPLYVGLTFYLPRPKVARDDVYSAKRPDIDKLVRSTLDGLTATGVFADDSQVAILCAEKRYVDGEQPTPGAHILVETIT